MVFTWRMAWTTTLIRRPVTGANRRVTAAVASCSRRSGTGGTSRARTGRPSTSSWSRVGTECRPSATTAKSRWSKVTGPGAVTSTHGWWTESSMVGDHAVPGSPSKALCARARRSPGSQVDEVATAAP